MTTFFMARDRQMLCCVDFVAVAVNAIVFTPGGSNLLTSPNSAKAVQKVSPRTGCAIGEKGMA